MRIFWSFLALLCTGLLFFVPVTEGVTAFRTDVKEDELPSSTAVGVTTSNLTLTHQVYNADTTGMTFLSSLSTDAPTLSAYSHGDHTVLVAGLSANATRTLTITYDISALTLWSGVGTLMNYTPLIWYLSLVAFIVISLLAIWKGRNL